MIELYHPVTGQRFEAQTERQARIYEAHGWLREEPQHVLSDAREEPKRFLSDDQLRPERKQQRRKTARGPGRHGRLTGRTEAGSASDQGGEGS